MNDENKKYGGKWDSLFTITLIVGAFIVLDKTTNIFNSTKEEGNNPQIVTEPPVENGIGGQEINTIDLLTKPFIPPTDIFSNHVIYKSKAIHLGLWGDFQDVWINVKATTTNSGKNFTYISLSNAKGTYGGNRLQSGQISADEEAVFTKDKPLDVIIDLKNPVRLSRSKEEVGRGLPGSQMVTIWNLISPPPRPGTVAELIIAPYSEKGQFGDGSAVNQIQLNYTCAGEKDSCKAFLCDPKTLSTVCLERNVDKNAALNYQRGLGK